MVCVEPGYKQTFCSTGSQLSDGIRNGDTVEHVTVCLFIIIIIIILLCNTVFLGKSLLIFSDILTAGFVLSVHISPIVFHIIAIFFS